jgi:hypothetical protein
MYLRTDNLYSQSYFHRLIMAMGEVSAQIQKFKGT